MDIANIYTKKKTDSTELTFDSHINICTLNNVTETAQKLVKIQGKKLENCEHLQPLTYTNTVYPTIKVTDTNI